MFILRNGDYISGKANVSDVINCVIATNSVAINSGGAGYLSGLNRNNTKVNFLLTTSESKIITPVPQDIDALTISSISLINTSSSEVTGVYLYLGDKFTKSPYLNNVSIAPNSTLIINDSGFSQYPFKDMTCITNVTGGGGSSTLSYMAGENINSHTPVVLINNLLYKMDNTNDLHQNSFVGFTKTSVLTSSNVDIETEKITLLGWGLTPNVNYLAGTLGNIVTNVSAPDSFKKIIGFSEDSETLLIMLDNDAIKIPSVA